MPSTIAALPPPAHHISHKPEYDGAPDVPEIAFSELWQDKEEGLTFGDVLDIINPLQHIPVVSTIYRMATGDEIGVGSRVLGGTLFGGPLGLLGAGLTAIFEEISGGSVEEHVASAWNALTDETNAAPQVAATGETVKPQAATLPLEDDYATLPRQPAHPVAPNQAAGEQIASTAAAMPLPAPTADPLSPQQASQATPVAAAIQAIQRSPAQENQAAATNGNADRIRINRAIEAAQRAQAGLLLANLGVEKVDQASEADRQTEQEKNQPFQSHPYMLPRGAPPELINRAMEQALEKYQSVLQKRNATTTTASPIPASSLTQ